MVQLHDKLPDLEKRGLQVVAISYDPVATLKRFTDRKTLKLTLLSDPGSKTIDAYAVRNHEAPEKIQGIPHPVTFLIDKSGVIRAKLAREGYKDRHPVEELLEAAAKL